MWFSMWLWYADNVAVCLLEKFPKVSQCSIGCCLANPAVKWMEWRERKAKINIFGGHKGIYPEIFHVSQCMEWIYWILEGWTLKVSGHFPKQWLAERFETWWRIQAFQNEFEQIVCQLECFQDNILRYLKTVRDVFEITSLGSIPSSSWFVDYQSWQYTKQLHIRSTYTCCGFLFEIMSLLHGDA